MIRQSMEDLQGGDAPAATERLQLALRACTRRHCTSSDLARLHVAIGIVAASGGTDHQTAIGEFATAHRLDPSVEPDASYANASVMALWAAATGAASPATAAPVSRQLGDPCDATRSCGAGMQCIDGSCAAGDAPLAPLANEAARPIASGGPEGDGSPIWRFAIDAGGGLAAGVLSGSPEYAEYRVYPQSNGPTCGPPAADGSSTLACAPIRSAGLAFEGIIHVGLRVNLHRRVGLGLIARIQPDSSGVGILPGLFLGGRLYVALTGEGFVRRGLVVSAFAGSGFGQMQLTPAVNGPLPSAHVLSGLNNFHAGARLEYGFGILALGGELSLNLQFPNVAFVMDLQAFAGLHF